MQSPSRAAPGSIVGGRYALRTAIGHGGMGTVWRATDTILRREVAVKEVVLPPGLATSDQEAMYERTLREARAAAGLSHPSIVQVFDVVTEDGRPWIVMELLDARSLADMVLEDGPLAPRAVAKIGIALLGALEIAHAGGVLHRDVKPANVLITKEGRCVLTDFGVAKLPADVQLTTPGMVLGSPHFISPERALGQRFGPPSDLFSLGVTLYTAVEGRPPFDKGDPLSTMHSVVEDPPLPPQRCGPLVDVLYGLMEKDPEHRWDVPTARGVLRELLAGPLAQNASPQHVTDPYSVVPQQPVAAPIYAQASQSQKQVGGRAMLQTGEHPQTRGGARHSTANYPAIGPSRTPKDNRMRLAIASGVGVVLVLATVSWAVWGGSGKDPGPKGQQGQQTTQASPTRPPGQEVSFRSMNLILPTEWKQASPTSGYLDLFHSGDTGRRLRLNAVEGEKDVLKTLEHAEGKTLKDQCTEGLERVALRPDVTLAGTKGAELEFICTTNGKPRHGIWRMVRIGDAMRHVYLLTWEANFAADKAAFDTAVQTFKVA
ncbi:MAG TPA: serine/threonine-protein kinase [Candidatus Limnocylindrales bacterium]